MRAGRLCRWLAVAVIALAPASCALRFGRGAPETYRVALATVPQGMDEAAVDSWLARLEADVTFVASRGDDVVDFALRGTEPLGDTTLTLAGRNARLLVQDALFETGRGKPLDLMAVSVPAGADARESTRALMTYVATDVDHESIVLLALRAPDLALADSIGMLLEPAFAGVARCADQHELVAGVRPGALRLYYRPAVRVRCDAVRGFDSPFPALLARVVLDG